MIDISKEVVKIKLTSSTGEVKEAKVYTRFASDAYSRVVQMICDLIGGDVVYFRFVFDDGLCITIPVADRRTPTMVGNPRDSRLGYLNTLARAVDGHASTTTIFGESRVIWTPAIESVDESGTELDYGPEHLDGLSGDLIMDGNLTRDF